MSKKVNINSIDKLNTLIQNITEEVLRENFYEGDDKIVEFLERLCQKMGASFAEYDEENGYYVIVSNSMLDLRYIFEPDANNIVKLVKIQGIEEFKQAFNEISVLRHVLEGKELTKIS